MCVRRRCNVIAGGLSPTIASHAFPCSHKNQKKYFGNNSMISLIRSANMKTGFAYTTLMIPTTLVDVARVASNTTITTTITG
jgi:hypothetical protein